MILVGKYLIAIKRGDRSFFSFFISELFLTLYFALFYIYPIPQLRAV